MAESRGWAERTLPCTYPSSVVNSRALIPYIPVVTYMETLRSRVRLPVDEERHSRHVVVIRHRHYGVVQECPCENAVRRSVTIAERNI